MDVVDSLCWLEYLDGSEVSNKVAGAIEQA
jgi:hypothetical protein